MTRTLARRSSPVAAAASAHEAALLAEYAAMWAVGCSATTPEIGHGEGVAGLGSGRRQRGAGGAQQAQRRERVEQEQLVDGVVVHLGERPERDHPGRVDHAGQGTVRLERRLHRTSRTVGGGEVDRGGRRTVDAQGRQPALVAADERQPGACLGEPAGDQGAEATGGAGEQDGAVGQVDGGVGGHGITVTRVRGDRTPTWQPRRRPRSSRPPRCRAALARASLVSVSIEVLDWRRQVQDAYDAVCGPPRTRPRGTPSGWPGATTCSPVTRPARCRRWPGPAFGGLPVAAYDPAFRFEVDVVSAQPHRMEVPTGTDGVVPFDRVGAVELAGIGRVDVWWLGSYGGGLFLPLRDGLAGRPGGTFGGGRYVLDTVKGADLGGEGDRLVVDLNFAYNPSCAYDAAWACPLAPGGNTVAAQVPVGELMPDAGWA